MPEYTAVLDRFEGDDAVLLLEEDGETVGDVVVPRTDLPSRARRQDAVVTVRIEDDAVVDLDYDPEETTRRREDAQSRFDRLARRPDDEE
ncbi:DUF3006 domain-containing protein [Halomarina ordinaria]|uniref:DUF3006 domain-containing protein n=1 Tax=Halomarina ordinaria TaxID=3033939 RepID=A0ABD5U5C6_9EURY|nr:DUF3006 domain-containing protein [Halomarina sp. PSRA2]